MEIITNRDTRERTNRNEQSEKLLDPAAVFTDRNCTWRFYREPGFRYTVADLAEFRRNLWTDEPVVLNFGILVITFGLTIRITMASIVGVIIAVITYRLV